MARFCLCNWSVELMLHNYANPNHVQVFARDSGAADEGADEGSMYSYCCCDCPGGASIRCCWYNQLSELLNQTNNCEAYSHRCDTYFIIELVTTSPGITTTWSTRSGTFNDNNSITFHGLPSFVLINPIVVHFSGAFQQVSPSVFLSKHTD